MKSVNHTKFALYEMRLSIINKYSNSRPLRFFSIFSVSLSKSGIASFSSKHGERSSDERTNGFLREFLSKEHSLRK